MTFFTPDNQPPSAEISILLRASHPTGSNGAVAVQDRIRGISTTVVAMVASRARSNDFNGKRRRSCLTSALSEDPHQ